ncbi:MAG: PBP1A family penicillin-binding protein [Myxococcota bacterium]
MSEKEKNNGLVSEGEVYKETDEGSDEKTFVPKESPPYLTLSPLQIPLKKRLLWAALFLFSFNLASFLLFFWLLFVTFTKDLPDFTDLTNYRPPITTKFFARDATLVGEFAIQRRDVVPYEKIPTNLVKAFVAAEDSSFFSHFGIDPVGIIRAAIENLKAGSYVQGGSTITQQVAKSFVGREKTITRKLREMFLALRLELDFDKRDILYLYLNQIYLGHGAYGVESAAQSYYRKHCWELSLAEMATLAGLPQAPSKYSPYINPKSARARQEYVLRRMFEEGYISAAERDEALKEYVVVNAVHDYFREEAPYYTEHVRRYVYDAYGQKALYEGGLRVYMAMDLKRQLAAEKALIEGVRVVDKRQGYRGALENIPKQEWQKFTSLYEERVLKGAPLEVGGVYVGLVTELSGSGEKSKAAVKVGKRDVEIPIWNMRWAREWVFGREWQTIKDVREALKVGDAILLRISKKPEGKPIEAELDQIPLLEGALMSVETDTGYFVAMIGGYDFERSEFNRAFQACRQPGSAFKPIVYSAAIEELGYNPSTIIIDSPIIYDDPEHENRWKPENYTEEFEGDVTLRTALIHSRNVPAIKVLQAVGLDRAVAQAKKLGINTPLNKNLSLALGGSCVTLYEMVNANSVFARLGRKQRNVFITHIVDRDGRIIEDNRSPYDVWNTFDVTLDRGIREALTEDEWAMRPDDTYVLVSILKDVCREGTGAAASSLGRSVAGKTGTTNDAFDAWFIGFSPSLVAGVWVGFDTYERPLGRWETGGKAALPIWKSYMADALKNEPNDDFPIPPGIVFRTIDARTGLLAIPQTPAVARAAYKYGTEPTEKTLSLDRAEGNQFFKVDSDL